MEILQIVGIAILVTVILVLLRQTRPEMAVQLSLVAGVVVFLVILGRLAPVLRLIDTLASRANVQGGYVQTVFKIVGVAYISEFGAQVCRDAREEAMATKVEFGGKVLILALAAPIIMAVVDTVVAMLP